MESTFLVVVAVKAEKAATDTVMMVPQDQLEPAQVPTMFREEEQAAVEVLGTAIVAVLAVLALPTMWLAQYQ
jgi:uncharacterized membrane protein YdbT with pleckstrin-like domain